jgi:hypothetical protein
MDGRVFAGAHIHLPWTNYKMNAYMSTLLLVRRSGIYLNIIRHKDAPFQVNFFR